MIELTLGVVVLIGWLAMVYVVAHICRDDSIDPFSRLSALLGGLLFLGNQLSVVNDALGWGL